VPLKRRNSSGTLTELFQPLLYESLIPYEAVLGMIGGSMGPMHHQDLVFAYCIDLPRSEADLFLTDTPTPLTINITAKPRLRFLIVDDSDLCRKVVATKMQTSYHVICEEVMNGAEAVVKIFTAHNEDKVYDCIIMDNTMPVLCGAKATAIIRIFGYEGKIFGATGNVLQEELDYFAAQGCDKVFTKPLKITDYDFIFQSNLVFKMYINRLIIKIYLIVGAAGLV
jgi:CheY-like chemotaxis protein